MRHCHDRWQRFGRPSGAREARHPRCRPAATPVAPARARPRAGSEASPALPPSAGDWRPGLWPPGWPAHGPRPEGRCRPSRHGDPATESQGRWAGLSVRPRQPVSRADSRCPDRRCRPHQPERQCRRWRPARCPTGPRHPVRPNRRGDSTTRAGGWRGPPPRRLDRSARPWCCSCPGRWPEGGTRPSRSLPPQRTAHGSRDALRREAEPLEEPFD